jgi:hypothetical protein
MDTQEQNNWFDANRRYLTAALAEVRHIIRQSEPPGAAGPVETQSDTPQSLETAAAQMSMPPTLETLCLIFGLSPFERNLLLMCAGVELDASFAGITPCFSLAMSVFPDAHWSALNPAAPLRHWRLLETGNGDTLTTGRLRIDERVLHYLVGVSHTDERLMGIVKPLAMSPASPELVPSYRKLAQRMERVWSTDRDGDSPSALPVIQLCGRETVAKQAIASSACAALGLNLFKISAHALPPAPAELDALMRLWEREALLDGGALFIDCDFADITTKDYESMVAPFIEEMRSFLVISSRDPRPTRQRPIVTLQVEKPPADEQRTLWQQALGSGVHRLNGHVDRLVSQFDLGLPVIYSASAEALAHPGAKKKDPQTKADGFGRVLWNICRMQSRPKLDDLAKRIEPAAGWEDLVLPASRKQVLREISLQVRWRARVYDTWGFAAKSSRGLGISALFTGDSGTGKTMAAEVLADELELDLYRIDLSQVVSKYIGETEKNLRRIFDAAEDGGVILFFDEADALFGKRTQVKDSHDRYANIEVSYLLQRMEAYRGLAILTTNMKDALDDAFLRRIRFVVKFPFPGPEQRAQIWQRIYPAGTPTRDLDPARLAQLNITGGNIRNIALNAAFLAADDGEPVNMKHILQSVRSEYGKLEKTLNAVEIAGWLT